MNATESKREPSDDLSIDLLVDGELDDREQRELLARLDAMPNGWRRCALAFLENQCLRRELPAVRFEPSVPSNASIHSEKRSFSERWKVPAAMAASFFVALALGMMVRNGWHEAAPSRTPSQMSESVAATQDEPPFDNSGNSGEPWRMVTLSVGDDPSDTIQLPCRVQNAIDPDWLDELPPAMPVEVREALLRAGNRVIQQRQLIPVPLKDGGHLVVPVDQVEIQYVGYPAYQ